MLKTDRSNQRLRSYSLLLCIHIVGWAGGFLPFVLIVAVLVVQNIATAAAAALEKMCIQHWSHWLHTIIMQFSIPTTFAFCV